MEQTMSIRRQKGIEIARTSRITKTDKGWKVPSQSGTGTYLVVSNGFEATCSCPDYEMRMGKYSHNKNALMNHEYRRS